MNNPLADCIAKTPKPPYYAVIFTSLRTEGEQGCGEMAARMAALASSQPGFPGLELVRETLGISVSCWSDLESIRNWKDRIEYREAQKSGRERWYARFKIRIARVERDYGMEALSPRP